MSSPSDRQQPVAPADPAHPTTQEIPVVAPAAPGAVQTQQLSPVAAGSTAVGDPGAPTGAAPAGHQGGAGVDADGVHATGPVGFVPGLPGAGNPPPPTSPQAEARPRRPRDRTAMAGLGLVALAVVLLELGLGLGFGGRSLWSTVPLWSAFATVAALLGLLAFAAFYPSGNRLRSGPAWRVAAGGLVGLAVFWLLVVLPSVASDRGFVLTAALACLGGALWIGPRPKD